MIRGWLEALGWTRKTRTTPGEMERIQHAAWKQAGLLDRLGDPSFAYSPDYQAPPEVAGAILGLITLAGQGPLSLAGPSSRSPYQETIVYPFLEAAYARLAAAGEIPPDLELGRNLHLGTAPLGSIYPAASSDHVGAQHFVVFSTGMLALPLFVAEILVAAAEHLGDSPTLEDVFNRSSPADLVRVEPALHRVSESLYGIVVENWPYPSHGLDFVDLSRRPFVAEMLSDVYAFQLGHELAHLRLEHEPPPWELSGATRAAPRTRQQKEHEADIGGLQSALKSRQPKENTMPAFVAVFAMFEMMSLVYRTVNYLAFRRDYSQMSADQMRRLYTAPAHLYPHPRRRLFDLVQRVKASHDEFSDRLDRLEYACRAFFDNVWLHVLARMDAQPGRPSRSWAGAEEIHERAHA